MGDPTREAVAAAARDIAARLGLDTLRRDDFFKESSFTRDQVYRLFPDDGWRGVLEAAGLRVLDDDWVTHVARVIRHGSRTVPRSHANVTRSTRVPRLSSLGSRELPLPTYGAKKNLLHRCRNGLKEPGRPFGAAGAAVFADLCDDQLLLGIDDEDAAGEGAVSDSAD